VTDGKPDPNTVVPLLFDKMFPDWFAGVCFAAIAIGALVPAAIMSIAAANLWTRNIYKEYLHRDATPGDEARSSKLASLVVKAGAVVVILLLDPQFSIDLQLIGGVIILQTLPAIVLGLYTRFFHAWGLLAGWAVGLARAVHALRHAERDDGQGALRRPAVRAVELRLRHEDDDLHGIVALAANLIVATVVTAACAPRSGPTARDADAPATTSSRPATRPSSRCPPPSRRAAGTR
jgi:SSS family solute:Na+ symporter